MWRLFSVLSVRQLGALIADVAGKAAPVFADRGTEILTSPLSSNPARAGVVQGLVGTAVLAVLVAATAALSAQAVSPSCRMCPGTYIPKSELDAYAARAVAQKIVDQQVRAVDVGKTNVGIGVVYRGVQTMPGEAAVMKTSSGLRVCAASAMSNRSHSRFAGARSLY